MSTLSWLLCLTLLSIWLASALTAAERGPAVSEAINPFQAVQTFSESVGDDSDDESNTLMFASPESMQQMRERLSDPAQRQAFREQQRHSMRRLYTDLEQALGIDAATQEKLLDLLVDRQVRMLEEFHGERGRNTLEDHTKLMQAHVDSQTRHLEALRSLLGEEAFERWPDYETSLGERTIANSLDVQLDAGSKLLPEQKERFIALLQEHDEQELEQQRLARSPAMPTASVRLGEDLGRAMHLHAIAENEAQLRRKPESDRLLAERAAQFLTPAQLAALSEMHARETHQLRQSIERMRAQVGQSAEPAESAETASVVPQRAPVTGDVRVDLRLTVNRGEPLTQTHSGPNGGTFEFQAGEDLWVQAQATLFDDDWLDVQLSYYENSDGKKRRLAGRSGHGMMVRQPDGSSYDLSHSGSSSTMASGRKAYYVSVSANAVAL